MRKNKNASNDFRSYWRFILMEVFLVFNLLKLKNISESLEIDGKKYPIEYV